ncbi:MAG: SGNH/GDSL hydrolase family protein [Candidatus Sumerlaeota bacterium]
MKFRTVNLATILMVALILFQGKFIMETNAQDYPPPPEVDTSGFGSRIQRTMHLLETSTPEKRNKVRILFYGQSITKQKWTDQVADYLRQKYPHADLEIENRAIGGFSSQHLVRTAMHDLYPFYPDLMIFHVYGSHHRYEDIIASTRYLTATEIAITNDHGNRFPKIPEKKPIGPVGKYWDYFMNEEFLPSIAEKYNCEFIDLRNPWFEYLEANDYEPSTLLRDGVHLNPHGEWLMAELVKPYLRYIPDGKTDKGLVEEYKVGEDVEWKDGKLTLEIDGNRVDVVPAAADGRTATIMIDGHKPSEYIGTYAATLPRNVGNVPWPWTGLKRVTFNAMPMVETWTLKTLSVDETGEDVTFEVVGSVTGPDGTGSSKEKFVSDSGRVVIEPEDWNVARNISNSKKPAPEGYSITWKIVPYNTDQYASPEKFDPAREQAVTLAQGIPNEKHTVEIIAADPANPPAIKILRVYRPPLKELPKVASHVDKWITQKSPGEDID